MAGIKKSRQRDALLAELQSRYDHPTAEDLYLTVKKNIPNLSLGTVYRNLSLLVDEGEIIKISSDGADRYDGCAVPHCHFSCTKCGKMSDIILPENTLLINDDVIKSVHGSVEKYSVTLFGICDECEKNNS